MSEAVVLAFERESDSVRLFLSRNMESFKSNLMEMYVYNIYMYMYSGVTTCTCICTM